MASMKKLQTSAQRFSLTGRQSASNKMPRQVNRSLLFNLIRTRDHISRADLARISDLQKSTVSLIVEDLIASGWITEGSLGGPTGGRRPTTLHLNDKRAVIALDIHPSQTSVAVTDLGGRIVSQSVIDLPERPERVLVAIIGAIQRMVEAHRNLTFDGIGVCLPGRLDSHHDELIFAPNLTWPTRTMKASIEKATGLRVEMENVANACALSEVWFGDSDGMHDLVVVNVSEGIGTGIFANGRILRGEDGMAGEFGHVQVDRNGLPCACGSIGCWETVASNRAAIRYYQELSKNGAVSFDALLKLAQSDDAHAIEALTRVAIALGAGMRMIATVLAPREIVVVGDLTAAWYRFGPIVEAEMHTSPMTRLTRIRPPHQGGNTARLRSAAALLMNHDIARP